MSDVPKSALNLITHLLRPLAFRIDVAFAFFFRDNVLSFQVLSSLKKNPGIWLRKKPLSGRGRFDWTAGGLI